jgi:hypothetical protein
MDRKKRKFVIEFIGTSVGCISDEVAFETDDVVGLCSILDLDGSDLSPSLSYHLDPPDVDKIKTRFGIVEETPNTLALLRTWHELDERPYKIHTNRELVMMLSGEKPFSAFSEWCAAKPEREYPEKYFDPYVKSGLFVKKVFFSGEGKRKAKHVLYAKVGEEWRIEAHMLLMATATKEGWNRGFERMEGSLLGYTDWQNDVHIDIVYGSRKK